ncbi:SMI1/KNR4 family protein [Streptomyces sp. NPDC008092]|uniref:SMI1/KNR4 family protein n=1 Tax=Streptomyces sp. NPDC008092 TaxID=3364808 RepID=UPI0036E80F18
MPALHDFATWEPVLRLLRAAHPERLAAPGGQVVGRIGLFGWSLDLPRPTPPPGRAAQVEDVQDEFDAVQRVQEALAEAGADDMAFAAEIRRDGRTVLHLIGSSPAVTPGIGDPHPGSLILVEDAVPEPWRRLPEPMPHAVPHPSADPELLERTLRERLPDAVGATGAEIAAAEARLGVPLPAELRALYRVTRAHWEDEENGEDEERGENGENGQDWGDGEDSYAVSEAVGCEVLPLDEVFLADASTRPADWRFAAKDAVVTPPDAAVQGLVGSPGWIVFGDNGGGDLIAVDLTPGPAGHTGQIIMIGHEDHTGADLLAGSLTDLVVNLPEDARRGGHAGHRPPAVGYVNHASIGSVEEAAHPGLEVLSIGAVEEGQRFGLAPVVGLPRLRTLSAYPGTLADPLEIAQLTGLEFLALSPEDWRVLLDASAVPRSLSAAAVEVYGDRPPLSVVALANEILALWSRPPIPVTVLEGTLAR